MTLPPAHHRALVVSVVIFMVQLAVEGARARREAIAQRARRLCYVETDVPVDAPAKRYSNGYHLFLSHVVRRSIMTLSWKRGYFVER